MVKVMQYEIDMPRLARLDVYLPLEGLLASGRRLVCFTMLLFAVLKAEIFLETIRTVIIC
jgi:hypothetical protein